MGIEYKLTYGSATVDDCVEWPNDDEILKKMRKRLLNGEIGVGDNREQLNTSAALAAVFIPGRRNWTGV